MSGQNSGNEPENGGMNPWVKSLMIGGGVFLLLLVVVSPFGGGATAPG